MRLYFSTKIACEGYFVDFRKLQKTLVQYRQEYQYHLEQKSESYAVVGQVGVA